MPRYKHILIAVDLKPEDDEAVSQQAELIAHASGSKLSIIHVVEPVYTYGIPPGAEMQLDIWQDNIKEKAKAKLDQLGEKLNIPTDQQIFTMGSPRAQILSTAESIGADLIVVGHHGRHGLNALVIGNTADDMVHNAKCDVLAVHVK